MPQKLFLNRSFYTFLFNILAPKKYACLEKENLLTRKPDFASGFKLIWFALASLLLGPVTLWFTLFAKKRRRNLQPKYFQTVFLAALGFLVFQLILFCAPLHWGILLAFYLVAVGLSAWFLHQEERSRFFKIRLPAGAGAEKFSLGQAILAAALAIYPLIYILSLLHNIGELESFSINLPSDVYTDGLLWMLYGTPLVLLAGLAAWKASLKPGLRALVYFYGAVLVVLVWIMVWEKFDTYLLSLFYSYDREPILFSFRSETTFRLAVKTVFYGSAFVLGTGYLVGAARTNVFLKRAVFLGLPSLLLYADMLFVLGDWNYYLAGIKERAFTGRHFGIYRLAVRSQLKRTPLAYRIPESLEEWSELEYQDGNKAKSISLLHELVARCGSRPYYARMRKQAERSLAALGKPPIAVGKADASGSGPALRLYLPLIKPASYLDQEWYALLSAVAFLKPSWTDLELKKRLLDLSNTVQLNLPKLDNIPELIPALRQLEIPVSPCFLTKDRIKAALAAGHIPFLSLYGHWVPISGYDPGRDGFYYYSYQAPSGWDWFRNEDIDLFYHHEGEAFGHGSRSAGKTGQKSNPAMQQIGPNLGPLNQGLQKFIPADELAEHVVDIGGVGLVLGDSAMVGLQERQAAYLVELGDVYYQEHENYEEAASVYKRAGSLYPGDQVFSRMLYLKRRYWESASDAGDYQNLFREYPPDWMIHLGPDQKKEKEIVTKIMNGKLGSYLMMNWYVSPLPDTSAESKSIMDTAMTLFTLLHAKDPEEPLYTDSLATLMQRRGDLKGSEKYYAELTGLYPFGSESAVYRLAWTKFKLGKLDEITALLDRCPGFSKEAKFLTLKAAVAMRKGRYRSAYASLSRSLKLDKSIGETHVLMADYYRHRGDKAAAQVHVQWQRRST